MPGTRGPNNKAMAERLGRQGRFVEAVRDDAEAAGLLAGRGYTAAKLAEGLALHAAAQKTYGGRNEASGAAGGASDALARADRDARGRLSELRSTLRAMYDGQPAHLEALGVTRERLSGDRDTFLTEARATLAAVRKAPYVAEAAEAGQDKKALDAAEAAVDALSAVATASDAAGGGAEASTTARDAAYAAFQTWMSRFRRFVRIALKDHPDVAARVGS